jgi:hypothetical protein
MPGHTLIRFTSFGTFAFLHLVKATRCRLLRAGLFLALVTGGHPIPVSAQDTIITNGATWRWRPGTNEVSTPFTAWRTNGFNDATWLTGTAPFSYGTNATGRDEGLTTGTVVSNMISVHSSIFLRRTFVITNVAEVQSVAFNTYYDDGFAAWINGVPVLQQNMPTNSPAYTNFALVAHEADPAVLLPATNSPQNYLVVGTNVLAVQVFNNQIASSDLRFETTLQITKGTTVGPLAITNVVPATNSTIGALTQITVLFNKPVQGVAASDLLVNFLPATSVIGSAGTNIYTFTFTQPLPGTVQASWDDLHDITDLSGTPFIETAAGASWTYVLTDTLAPQIGERTPVAAAQVSRLMQTELTFSEPVVGVNASDLLINGSPATNFTGSGAGPYIFSFPQPLSGTVQFSWAGGHGITDTASSPNAFAGGNWSVTLNPAVAAGDVIINEFLAASLTGLLDENGEQQDWIEVYNRGSTTVNLLGWSLTEDANVPGKWTFPSTNLAPGQYLVVFASEKNRRVPGARLHTNFKLEPFGEYLALFNAESPRVAVSEFTPKFPEQRNDYSYGLSSLNVWLYYQTPTPGAANGSSSLVGVAPEPHFSVGRGLFDSPFNLLLTTTLPGATIRYTTDGTEPTVSAGFVYSSPVPINITTTLRAAVFAANYLPSRTRTHTYVFPEQVIAQPNNPAGFPATWGPRSGFGFPGNLVPGDYEMDPDPLRVDPNDPGSGIDPVKLQRLGDGLRELPVVSIVMNVEDMFGATGIYSYPNVTTKGFADKPCSIEMFLPDGSSAFAETCGIGIHGNASRQPEKNPKHGFKLSFNGSFGNSTLKYQLFPDSPAQEFDDVILRADFGVSWRHWSDVIGEGNGSLQRTRASRFRDAWMKNTAHDMGVVASHNRFCQLYLNGVYWGVYDFSEQPKSLFGANTFGGTTADYDVYEQGAFREGAAPGGSVATYNTYQKLTALPTATGSAEYEAFKQYLDLPEYIDYVFLHFFVGHRDWGTAKNWYALRQRAGGSFPTEGKFKYAPWDGECVLLNTDNSDNRIPDSGGGNNNESQSTASGLHAKLKGNTQYRLDFADRVHKHMIAPGGALTAEANSARWLKWQNLLDNAITAESVRWGDYRRDVHPYLNGAFQLYTREDHWLTENSRVLFDYFPNRTANMLGWLRTAGLYPAIDAPEYRQDNTFGPIVGSSPVGTGYLLAMNNPGGAGTVYYTTNGSDPRVEYAGTVGAAALTYAAPLTLNSTLTIKSRVLTGGVWSALNEATFTVGELGVPLRITELMYNPLGGDAYEFLEVQNVGPLPLDVGGFSFQGLTYVFPAGTILQPGAVWLLANNANPVQFAARYPSAVVSGYFSASLDNGGERLSILDGNGATVVAVHYDDEAGWPALADGGGYSLEIIDPRGDPNAPANWRASSAVNGTPGLPPVAPTSSNLVINEIAADNAGSVTNGGLFPDWIELRNLGGSPTNIAGWSLTDDSNARQFVFPANTTINPGGFLVVWCDIVTNAPGLHTGFALGRNGETISLFNASTTRVDAVTYGLQLTDKTVGRIASEWRLTVPTPNAANVAAPLAAPSNLTLNEWLANPGAGQPDWLELFNRSFTAPVALRGLYFGTSNAVFRYSALSFIAPRSYAQLFADEQAGAEQLEFKLPAIGGAIALYDPTAAPLDGLTYGLQTTAVSEGRLPDGEVNIATFAGSASPGASNYLLAYTGPVLNEVLARNDRAAVSPWGSAADFVELFNSGGGSVSLSGMAIGDSDNFGKAWKFPVGASIPAGGYLLVWCDGARAASTSANGPHNTGFALSGDSGVFYLFNSLGQPVDLVNYGAQIQDLPLGRNGNGWQLLATPTPGGANAAAATLGSVSNLRFNEWMATPLTGDDWFELYNADALPMDLGGLYLTDNPSTIGITNSPIAPLSFIGGKKWALFKADGNRSAGHDHVNFSLDQLGETLRLYDTNLQLIDVVDFGLQSVGTSQGRLPDGTANIANFPTTSTPGEANYLPIPGIVISEVLTHTDAPLEDAVEFFNPTTNSVNLGGWFLSDSQSDLKRYRIPDDTTIPAGGFKVFYQSQFGPPDGETDAPPLFTFNSAHGDAVYLSEADGGHNLTGYRLGQSFDAAANGVSFGRHQTSVGVDFVPLSARTFGVDNPANLTQFRSGTGKTNPYPLVGPVVINEIMYHPPDYGNNSPDDEEFIELLNLSSTNVSLFDPAHATNVWRLANAVIFDFATNQTIAANARLLVVDFHPTNTTLLNAFRARYGTNATVVGPFVGHLDNAGETIELWRPDVPQALPHPDAGFVPQLLVERITYSDTSPWPTNADGFGASLQRITSVNYGNDPANWRAAVPTAGQANLTAPTGTATLPGGGVVRLTFDVQPGLNCQVEYKNQLADVTWQPLGAPRVTTNTTLVVDDSLTSQTQRFYRLNILP